MNKVNSFFFSFHDWTYVYDEIFIIKKGYLTNAAILTRHHCSAAFEIPHIDIYM